MVPAFFCCTLLSRVRSTMMPSSMASFATTQLLGVLFVISLRVVSATAGQESESECAAGTDGDDICSSAAAAATTTTTTTDECGLYLAPSSIPGAGFGIYSTFAHPVGSIIGQPDILHPLVNKRRSVIESYEWDGASLGTEYEGQVVTNLAPGFGMLVNGHYELDNVALELPAWSDAGLHRSTSPAAGSFTLLHNVSSVVTQDIPAGAELFLNYGVQYFRDRPQFRGKVFTKAQFAFSDRLNKNLAEFADFHGAELTTGDKIEGRTMNLIRGILLDIPELAESTKLVPKTFEEVKKVAQIGAARNQFPESIRSPEWIKDNGWCIDNLRPDVSSKLERGRGAFATRSIRNREVVVASPMLYLFESQLDYVIDEDNNGSDDSTAKRKQLILNYCFGHNESSLVLFPYSPITNLINHDSAEANVELRWAADDKQPDFWKEGRRREILTKDGRKYGGAGMILEYVASRDIEEGEEVVLNYGSAWEEAWDKHVAEWSAPSDSETYVEAFVLTNSEVDNHIRTAAEQELRPYPSDTTTACFVEWYRDYSDFEDIGEDGTPDSTAEIEFEWVGDDSIYQGHHMLRPCKILERDGGLYTVQLLNKPQQDKMEAVKDFERVTATGVPREAIIFVNKLYSTDHYLESAFRHTMGMGNIWPLEWKDLR